MAELTKESEIWAIIPTDNHRERGALYASRTLPWTFDRMMKNTKPRGQQERALNIAKGIVVQEALAEKLLTIGVKVQFQRKSHRDEDLFDFNIIIAEKEKILFDVKSIAYYNDYSQNIRAPFSKKLLIDNKDYSGPDWRRFFPMLVPHTQIGQAKEGYIFAITESCDFRRQTTGQRKQNMIVAFPYGEHLPFFTYKRLCLERERARKGFYVSFEFNSIPLFQKEIEVSILYEWLNEAKTEHLRLQKGKLSKSIGPVSALNCLAVSPDCYLELDGTISCYVTKNDFREYVPNSSGIDINELPSGTLDLSPEAFCNLILPDHFNIYVIGWILKDDFLSACRKYPAWVWPDDSKDPNENRPWSQITERDIKNLTRAGFEDCIDPKTHRINAGWMKTSGVGPGTCCYVFPNTYKGGVKETNLYVLPQDLNTMSSFGQGKK